MDSPSPSPRGSTVSVERIQDRLGPDPAPVVRVHFHLAKGRIATGARPRRSGIRLIETIKPPGLAFGKEVWIFR